MQNAINPNNKTYCNDITCLHIPIKKLLNILQPSATINNDALCFITDLLVVLLDYINCISCLVSLTDSISHSTIDDCLELILNSTHQQTLLKNLLRKIEKNKSKYKYRSLEYKEKFDNITIINRNEINNNSNSIPNKIGLNSISEHSGCNIPINLIDRLLSSNHQRPIVYNCINYCIRRNSYINIK